MINNIVVGGQIFALDTDTSEVTRTRELGWGYTRARYFVEKAGKFVFPKNFKFDTIDVDAGDFIVVFETSDDNYHYVKANLKDAITYMDEIDKHRKEMRKKRSEQISEDTCIDEDTCVGCDNN